MIVNNSAIVPLTPTTDQSAKEGYFVKRVGKTAVLVSAATDIPFGVLVDSEETTGTSSVAIGGVFQGIVTVKLGAVPGNVVATSLLQLNADATVKLDTGTGARVLVAMALESGTADELIQAVLIKPLAIGNAVAFGSTNGTAAAASANLANLAAETEKIGDDLRALYAALQAAGVLA